MTTRDQVTAQFALWLRDAGYANTQLQANRKAWDFVAGAYNDGDTLEDFIDAWEEAIEQERAANA